MRLLAHRGFWVEPSEKNGVAAFERAFAAGYGIETDVRDLDGTLVVSHDMPRQGCMPFATLLDMYVGFGRPGTLAINIKADGLQAPLQALLRERACDDYFVFDMSVPDSLGYLKAGMTAFMRRSEYEEPSVLEARADGLWFDCFEAGFSSPQEVLPVVRAGKKVALVSPELHRRDHREAWAAWRTAIAGAPDLDRSRLMLCTDFPDEAAAFFASTTDNAR